MYKCTSSVHIKWFVCLCVCPLVIEVKLINMETIAIRYEDENQNDANLPN